MFLIRYTDPFTRELVVREQSEPPQPLLRIPWPTRPSVGERFDPTRLTYRVLEYECYGQVYPPYYDYWRVR